MRKIGAFIATLFLVCLAGPVQAIPTMTDVTGSLSKAENTCVSPIALFTSDPPQSCNYSGGEDVNILVGQLNVRNWMGPLDSGGFYAPGTGPDPLTTSGSAPGDGKVNLVITGTITIEDNQTSGAGNGGDDTISGTLLIGAGERSVSTSGGSALESFTSITHTIPSKLVDSAVDNAMGGYDYVIGSAGFPLLLSSVTGDYPSESASIATGAPSPPDINVWDTLNGGNIAVQNPFPLPLTPPGGPYTVEIVTYAPSGGVPGPNKGVATTAVMTGATCLAGDGAGLPLTDCDPDPAVGAAATWSVSGAEFDNLILKLSTNADGKVVTADAFYVLEYIIPGLGANSPNADSFIGGTLTFAGNAAAADDSATTPQDTAVDIDILTNDFNFADSVTLATQGVTAGASVTINGINPGPQAGINVTYLPPAGFAGQDTFDYTIDDGTSMDMATVTVTVTSSGGGGNLFPIAPDTGISTGESQVLDINVATLPGVNLGNTPVTITVSNGPASGTATIFGSIITYTQKGFPASDVFDYTITDADGDSATGTIFVSIGPALDPTANNDTATADQDSFVNIAVLANDVAGSGDMANHTISIVPVPFIDPDDPSDDRTAVSGTAVVEADNTVTYTPDPGVSGMHTFQYTLTDENMDVSAAATVTIDVRKVASTGKLPTDSSSVIGPWGLLLLTAVAWLRRRRTQLISG